jgi:hypothetical protein
LQTLAIADEGGRQGRSYSHRAASTGARIDYLLLKLTSVTYHACAESGLSHSAYLRRRMSACLVRILPYPHQNIWPRPNSGLAASTAFHSQQPPSPEYHRLPVAFARPIQARHERRLADLLLCTCSRAEVIKGSFPSGFPSGQGFTPRGGPRATIQIS